VSELSHDTAEDGFHEIQLSGKQLVFLFMTATIVSVFIFLCGVLVGRGARDARLGDAVEASAPPIESAAEPQVADAGPPSAEPPAPAEAADELSYHKRLQGEGTPAEALRKPEPAPPVQDTPAPSRPTPQPAQRAAVPADVPTSGQPGTHLVQVFVSQDRAVAANLVKKLNGKGYPAFLVATQSRTAPQMYKVQVGRFSEREAEQVSRRLEKEEKFKPWISR
jgi:hypothetical protein